MLLFCYGRGALVKRLIFLVLEVHSGKFAYYLWGVGLFTLIASFF